MCLPLASTVVEVIQSADQQCIVGLLAKMGNNFKFKFINIVRSAGTNLFDVRCYILLAVDRSMQSSISDARDALINVCVDVLSAYKSTQSSAPHGLSAPLNLRLLPLYIAALLKSVRLTKRRALSVVIYNSFGACLFYRWP